MALTKLTTPRARWTEFKLKVAGALSRSLYDKLSERVSVKDFGAVGDGVTDDSYAFKQACAVSNNVLIPAGRYKFDSDEPIVARDGLTIYGDGVRLSRVIMGHNSKGGYGFISNPNKANEVSLENFGIYGTNTTREERDDSTDVFPHNLIELNGCKEVSLNKLLIKDWWAYYNYGSGKSPSVIAINDITGASVTKCRFYDCGNEVIVAKNNVEGVFEDLKFIVPREVGKQRLYTALSVIADNASGQQNTVKDCRITNITVKGSLGSAVNYTGSNSIIASHVYTDCRKGLDINAEQFVVSITDVMYGNVIDSITFDSSPEEGSYGLRIEANTETDDISISNVITRNTKHSGVTIAKCRRPTVNNITVINNSGTSKAFRVSSDKTLGTVPTRANISNAKVYDTSGEPSSGFIRGYDSLTLTGSSFENTEVELSNITNITLGDCTYSGYSEVGMFITGTLEIINIHDTTFKAASGFAKQHIRITDDSSFLGMTGNYFSDTMYRYNVTANNVAEGIIDNNRYTKDLILTAGGFNLSSAVGIGSGTNGWRQPIQLVNGFLFIDSKGTLRITSSQPTSDTDGIAVGTQS